MKVTFTGPYGGVSLYSTTVESTESIPELGDSIVIPESYDTLKGKVIKREFDYASAPQVSVRVFLDINQ